MFNITFFLELLYLEIGTLNPLTVVGFLTRVYNL